MAKLVEVKEENKKTSKPKIDLKKIKKLIDDNPEAVEKIKDGVTTIVASKVLGDTVKKTTKKGTSKKTSKKSSSSDNLSKIMDLAGTFLKK